MDVKDVLPPPELRKNLPKQTTYLAGSMEHSPDEGLSWRLEYREQLSHLNIDSVIPGEHESQISEAEMHQLKTDDIEEYIKLMRKFIDIDLKFVEDVDFVVVRWEGEIISGTVGEAQHAYLNNKPIYLVTSQPVETVPGWFLACFTEVFSSLSCLLLYLTKQSFYDKKENNEEETEKTGRSQV